MGGTIAVVTLKKSSPPPQPSSTHPKLPARLQRSFRRAALDQPSIHRASKLATYAPISLRLVIRTRMSSCH
ncbi:hypothetical protein EPR50_G00016570 [Perca flavescens]|uniref:Uncharacterized protein n=1 Tax=Perca flavescens TaxID=8167 RepID=A0A484DLM4_PERFV|nr:hypothetical protein EPR50_G00016570 [Perca flavescens]